MADFVHLHLHTEYSLLDGVNRSEALMAKVKENGMSSVAITDHGVMFGVPEFWKTAKDFDLKPIIGCEIYLSPAEHTLRQDVSGIKYYHLLLLAKNITGYKNLNKLVTIGHTEGMYYRPRVDITTIKKHSEGLICTTACLAGPLSTHIIDDQYERAEEWLKKLHAIFKDDFYLEIQRNGLCAHDEIDQKLIDLLPKSEVQEQMSMLRKQIKVNKQLYKYSEQYKISVVSTTDAHYLNQEDREAQKVLFAIKDGNRLEDPGARPGYLETYVKTPAELADVFSDMPEVMEETMKISEKVENFSIKFDRVQPRFWNIPKGKTSEELLKEHTYKGAKKKFGELSPELRSRLDYELKIIADKGYNDYFLVVGDLMSYARGKGIVIGVRGSAAGSMVSYCLGITNVDPLKWGLYFERFLNPERTTPPDIDMDIQDDRRQEIIDYAKEKYGEKNVAAICTFGKMMTKAAIRDVARVTGVDLGLADRLSKMVQVRFGKVFSYERMMEESPEFKEAINSDKQLVELGSLVQKIEGLNRHLGVHAAGYLITPDPVDEYMAYYPDPKDPNTIVTQMDGTWVDKLDFMKFDFLGLRTLTIIKNCLDYIEQRHDVKIDLDHLPEDDPATFGLFSRGETVGVFQFESPPMQRYLRDLKPETQEDICFLAAAYRPGPMDHIPEYIKCRHGEKEPVYLFPELEDALGLTYGYPIYQEQLLKICMDFGGFSMGEGDIIRNALKKKQLDILQAKEPDFVKYFVKHFPKYGEEKAKILWAQLKPFADYGFNKAHSASYAIIAYWCAYLKAHYPLEFVTALMHSDLESLERVVVDIKEARRLGYKVLPPSVNHSDANFSIEGEDTIRFGLAAIKNVGTKVCEHIVSARNQKGNFTSLDDLVSKVGTHNLNKKALECLIKVGALDDFGPRNALLAILPLVVDTQTKLQTLTSIGQMDMFGMGNGGSTFTPATPLPSLPQLADAQKILWEKEMMGVFLTSHPLDEYGWVDLLPSIKSVAELSSLQDGEKVTILATIESRKNIRTKNSNKPMAFLSLADLSGNCEGVMFNKIYEKYSDSITETGAYLFEGVVSFRDEKCSILIDSIKPAEDLRPPKKIKINITNVHAQEDLERLRDCFDESGEIEVLVIYGEPRAPKRITRRLKFAPQCIAGVRPYIVPN